MREATQATYHARRRMASVTKAIIIAANTGIIAMSIPTVEVATQGVLRSCRIAINEKCSFADDSASPPWPSRDKAQI